MRSVMTHSFSQVPRVKVPRSSFDRSHGHKTTFDADYLVPILVDDVIPGDTFNCGAHFVVRLTSPTLVPLMDNMFLETFFFFVPYRLLWSNWEKFMGAQTDPGDSIDFTIPAVHNSAVLDISNGDTTSLLYDYLGIPPVASLDATEISALPFRAYNLVFNEWFRDENLQNSLDVPVDNGPDAAAVYEIRKRGKRHDYFTSCLPWPQKGTAVDLPLAGNANVITTSVEHTTGGLPLLQWRSTAGALVGPAAVAVDGVGDTYLATTGTASATGMSPTNLYADMSSISLATINDLRLAFQTQRLLERDARSGTRYVEVLLAHFGVVSPDFRLQRPEFLGGGSTRISVSPVPQTTFQGTETLFDAKGAAAGVGHAAGVHGFTKSFVEHGLVLGLVNVRGDITYSQGIERYWHKSTRYDFYFPVLSQIGEQSVLNQEIFYQNTAADDMVFGYQERYAEYRYKPSRLSGLMRVDTASNLDEFHLSEDFAALPTLGDSFIQSNLGSPLDRAVSIPTQPHFMMDLYFDLRCVRPMPLFGVPGNLDHF